MPIKMIMLLVLLATWMAFVAGYLSESEIPENERVYLSQIREECLIK